MVLFIHKREIGDKMSKIISVVLCLIMVLSLCLLVPISASAQEIDTIKLSEQSEISETAFAEDSTVINVTAEEISKSSAYNAITNALNIAKDNATEENPYRVVVEPGNYVISYALCVYNNTTLVLNGVTLTRNRAINIIRTGYGYDEKDTGATGYCYENIAIEGGVLDGENSSFNNTMIKVVHAKNFSMRNVTLKNLYDAHMMEVAGCDGFTLSGCTFTDQIMPADGVCYEAVQLDILYSEHMNNCRSEDLSINNVLVENCTFNNCPRGIGTHTAILNNPFNNIVIRNNTFTNMKSVAIQSINWTNVEISGNTIDTAPRGIAFYSHLDQGNGTYKSSTIAAEGKTEAHYSDNYIEPGEVNVDIVNNTLLNIGSVKDIYASYECSAISVIGAKINTHQKYSDGSGDLPFGDYYLDGVRVLNNYITVQGHGLRIEDARYVNAKSNVIICSKNTVNPANYYGITMRSDVRYSSIKYNYIENASVNGLQIDECTNLFELTGNEIYKTGKYGIAIYDSSVKYIEDNIISNIPSNGIGVMYESNIISNITGNRVSNVTEYGIHIASDSASGIIEKNTTYDCGENIVYSKSSGRVKVGTNYTSNASVSSISLSESSYKMNIGESYKPIKTVNPVNAITTFTYTSSNPNVATVDKAGRVKALSVGTSTITVKTANGKTANVSVTVNAILGDVDHDTVVTVIDATIIQKYLAMIIGEDECDIAAADTDHDNAITIMDATCIQKYLAGIIDHL